MKYDAFGGRAIRACMAAAFATGLLVSLPAPAADAPGGPPPGASAEPSGGDATVAAPRPQRERELADRFVTAAGAGEVVWLADADGEFLAIYHGPTKLPPKGAILIVPGPGPFIDTCGLVRTLRRHTPAGGWATLALQQPLLPGTASADAHEAAMPAAVARVEAGIRHLRSLGIDRIVIAGVGRGAEVSAQFLAKAGASQVAAFAAVGAWSGQAAEIPVPILDVAGALDVLARRTAERRSAWFETRPERSYETLLVDGADRHFSGHEAPVAKRLRGWAERMALPAP